MRLISAISLMACWGLWGCGSPQDSALTSDVFSSASQADAGVPACPEGSSYDGAAKLCVTAKDALGPFPSTMVNKCIQYGGGDTVCRSSKWARSFATKIRGTGKCMAGASWDAGKEVCREGELAYGPFTAEQVARCYNKGGGYACATMRVHVFYVTDTPDPYKGERSYIRITRKNFFLYSGLYALRMELLSKDGAPLDAMYAVSGQDYAQYFRKAQHSQRGSFEPLPEGLWKVRYPEKGTGGNEWAGAPGDYDTYISDGLGPTFQEIVMFDQYTTEREAIGVHIDGNRWDSPGTAGCVGLPSRSDLKRYLKWFEDPVVAPTTLVVDWGLGTIPGEYGDALYLRKFTNFGLEDAYIPLMDRVNLIEVGN